MHSNNFEASISRAAAAALALVIVSVAGASTVHADTDVPLGAKCPSLYALGVQGTEEGAQEAGISSDSGALGQMFGPLAAAAGTSSSAPTFPMGAVRTGPPCHTTTLSPPPPRTWNRWPRRS